MESAAAGILAGINAVRYLQGKEHLQLPEVTMLVALSAYVADESVKNYQPMGAAMGLLPPVGEKIRDRAERYARIAERSLNALDSYIEKEQL